MSIVYLHHRTAWLNAELCKALMIDGLSNKEREDRLSLENDAFWQHCNVVKANRIVLPWKLIHDLSDWYVIAGFYPPSFPFHMEVISTWMTYHANPRFDVHAPPSGYPFSQPDTDCWGFFRAGSGIAIVDEVADPVHHLWKGFPK